MEAAAPDERVALLANLLEQKGVLTSADTARLNFATVAQTGTPAGDAVKKSQLNPAGTQTAAHSGARTAATGASADRGWTRLAWRHQ